MRRLLRNMTLAAVVTILFVHAQAGEPTTVPATRPTPVDEQRLNDYITLIEGPNLPLAARRTGARELLRLGWQETTPRLAAILASQNTPAKTAVALALADVSEFLRDAYIDPLISMLADPDADARHAAATALADYRNSGVLARLRVLMLDEAQPVPGRIAAIDALGLMTQREAAAALAEALELPNDAIAQAALRSFEQVAAKSFRDGAEAVAWWKSNRDLPPEEWQQAQLDRLIRRDRELGRRLHELEGRLVDSLRDDYTRTPDADRAPLLQTYLADTLASVRILGLELVQRQQGEGKKLPPDVVTQLRGLLSDPDPDVRVAAVQAVARLREPSDADRFLELLASERHGKVHAALVSGLGYVGTEAAVEPLLNMLADGTDSGASEVVAALGRMAERGVLGGQTKRVVADRLLALLSATPATSSALRERVLWAMGLLADARFGPAFVAALNDTEAPSVRQAAVRGIANLKDPQLADALVPLTRDADAALRRTAVEALAALAARDEQLAALWARLDPAAEPDAAVRRAAWTGALRLLSTRDAAALEQWLTRIPPAGAESAQHALDLLRLLEKHYSATPATRAELGRVGARIAAEDVAAGQLDEAVAAYVAALENLHAAGATDTQRVAAELLRFTLANDRYDETIAAALSNNNPPLDGAALWKDAKTDLEQRLTPEKLDQTVNALTALQAHPPAVFGPEIMQSVGELLARAREARQSTASSGPASQPTATHPATTSPATSRP